MVRNAYYNYDYLNNQIRAEKRSWQPQLLHLKKLVAVPLVATAIMAE